MIGPGLEPLIECLSVVHKGNIRPLSCFCLTSAEIFRDEFFPSPFTFNQANGKKRGMRKNKGMVALPAGMHLTFGSTRESLTLRISF